MPGSRRKVDINAKHQSNHSLHLEKHITPGAGEYEVKAYMGNEGTTAKIGDQNPKSDIEWQILRASQIPAPNAYQIGCVAVKSSGIIVFDLMTPVEWHHVCSARHDSMYPPSPAAAAHHTQPCIRLYPLLWLNDIRWRACFVPVLGQ